MYKKTLPLLFALLYVSCGVVWAQDGGIITGTVTDAETGTPLPGVNVILQGTQRGAATTADGEYRIEDMAPGTYTLAATFIGYETYTEEVDVEADETSTVDVTLQPGAIQLEGVAVTALGYRVSRDELATSTASISGEAITTSGAPSALEAMAAKAAGVNIVRSGGDPGTGARITIRGPSTISGDNQPLIVIDGVPVSNSTLGQGVGGVQQQSRLNDLNPEDIASIEILKGAAAAALWGSRALSGVVLIETKSGAAAAGGTNVTFKSTLTIDEVNKTTPLQQTFGQGSQGFYTFGSQLSWGDRIAAREGGEDDYITDPSAEGYRGVAVGQQTGGEYYFIPNGTYTDPHGGKNSREVYDKNAGIHETGRRFDTDLTISGGGQDGSYYLSLGHLTWDGIIRGDHDNYERTSVRLNARRDITDKLSITGIGSYSRVGSDRVQQGSNVSGLMLAAMRTPPDFNNADYYVNYYPEGTDGSFVPNYQRTYRGPLGLPPRGYDNPRFLISEISNTSLVNHVYGKVGAEYEPLTWISLMADVGVDSYSDRRQVFFPIYSSAATNGFEDEEQLNEYEITATLKGRAAHQLTENLFGTLTLGTQLSHEEYDFLGAELTNFANPVDFRSLSNAETVNVTAGTEQTVQRRFSLFGVMDLEFYDQVFLKLTGRMDNTSTFGPEADDTFFYPSASLAWQFSDLIPENDVFSFGKLRLNYGQVGREPNPYVAFTYFVSETFFDGYTGTTLDPNAYGGGFIRDENLGAPAVIPEAKTAFEVGADLRFFNDRLALSGTYYQNQSESLIFDVPIAPSTGFLTQTQNAAQMENWGLEFTADFTWLTTDDFSWTTYANWSKNENTVTDLAGVEEIGLEGFVSTTSSIVEGEPLGVLFGTRWRRESFAALTDAEVDQGYSVAPDGRILDPFGFPVEAATDGVVGDPNPDWNAGIGNTFRYKGLTLDVLFDIRHGGDVWNGTKGALAFFGRYGNQDWMTTISAEQAGELVPYLGTLSGPDLDPCRPCSLADLVDAGFYPSTLQNEDGSYTFRGYVKDFDGPGGKDPVIVNDNWFLVGDGSGFTGPGEQFIEDGGYVRLREVRLSYNWHGGLVEEMGLSAVNVSVSGRNLVLFTDYSGIDPETNLTGPSNGQGLDYFNNANPRSYQFAIQFTY